MSDNFENPFSGYPENMPGLFAILAEKLQAERRGHAGQLETGSVSDEDLKALLLSDFVRPSISLLNVLSSKLAKWQPPHKVQAEFGFSIQAPLFRQDGLKIDQSYGHLVLWTGQRPTVSPSLHLVFSAGGIGFGAGISALDQDQRIAIRTTLENPARRDDLIAALERAEEAQCYIEGKSRLAGSGNTVAALDFSQLAEEPGLIVRSRGESYPNDIFDKRCANWILERLSGLLALQAWLHEAVEEADGDVA